MVTKTDNIIKSQHAALSKLFFVKLTLYPNTSIYKYIYIYIYTATAVSFLEYTEEIAGLLGFSVFLIQQT